MARTEGRNLHWLGPKEIARSIHRIRAHVENGAGRFRLCTVIRWIHHLRESGGEQMDGSQLAVSDALERGDGAGLEVEPIGDHQLRLGCALRLQNLPAARAVDLERLLNENMDARSERGQHELRMTPIGRCDI